MLLFFVPVWAVTPGPPGAERRSESRAVRAARRGGREQGARPSRARAAEERRRVPRRGASAPGEERRKRTWVIVRGVSSAGVCFLAWLMVRGTDKRRGPRPSIPRREWSPPFAGAGTRRDAERGASDGRFCFLAGARPAATRTAYRCGGFYLWPFILRRVRCGDLAAGLDMRGAVRAGREGATGDGADPARRGCFSCPAVGLLALAFLPWGCVSAWAAVRPVSIVGLVFVARDPARGF